MNQDEWNVPSHMKLPSKELWQNMLEWFEDEVSFLESVRLESEAEALRALGSRYVPENLIRYRRSDARADLIEDLREAKAAIPTLQGHFESGVQSVEFLHSWGAFLYRCGNLRSAYFSETDDVGPARAGLAGGCAYRLIATRRSD